MQHIQILCTCDSYFYECNNLYLSGTRQPPRPPSATHLPRTSSPGPDGGKQNVAGSSSEPALSTSLPVATQPPPHPPSTNPGSSELQGGPSLVPRLSTRTWSPRPFIPRASYGAPPPGPPMPPHPPMGPRGWVGPPRGFPNMDRRHPPPPGPLPWRRPPPNEQVIFACTVLSKKRIHAVAHSSVKNRARL